MTIRDRLIHVLKELKSHSPFTLLGALTGIILMLAFRNVSHSVSEGLFKVFHPAHVVLSAMVTAAMIKVHRPKTNFFVILVVGYIGSIGIATLSDSIIPFFGESILGVAVPTHDHNQGAGIDEHDCSGEPEIHIGFIQDWYIVTPAAILGVLIAYFRPRTKEPHALHVLISTWASSFHVLMNTHQPLDVLTIIGILVVLFIAVWLPCCVSDIVFPTLMVRES